MHGQRMSRRSFLTGKFMSILSAKRDISAQANEPEKERGLEPDLFSDITPELLAFEAHRLGLDPNDRQGTIQALKKEMMEYKG